MPIKAAKKKTRSITEPSSANTRRSEVEDMLGTTARITGCVLGLSSVAVATPLMMAARAWRSRQLTQTTRARRGVAEPRVDGEIRWLFSPL